MNFTRPEEECGIFGIFNHPEASNLTYLGLYALQHRGQESCGIVSSDGVGLHAHKSMGLVADVFGNQDIFKSLPGRSAIGHVRYSTTGSSVIKNVQPIMVDYSRGSIAVAHNGNLVNAQIIKDELEAWGSIFQTTMDTEIIVHLLATSKASSLVERLTEALNRIKGAYCLLFLTETRMVAARDPHGFRPLCLGKLGDAYVVASESCALDLIEAEFIREIEPGEIVVIDKNGMTSHFPLKKVDPTPCIFEFVYFARPDSYIFGKNVYQVRKELGRQLAREHAVEADVVIPVPDSGVPAAMGYAEESGIRFELGLIRNHYVGRTFIEPQQSIRHFGVKIKLNPVREVLEGKTGSRYRRLDCPRHHFAQDRQDGQECRGQGGSCPHILPADQLSLLLRHRHTYPQRADFIIPYPRRDHQIHNRRLPRLSVQGRAYPGRRRQQQQLLQGLLLRRVSGQISHVETRAPARFI